MSIERLPTYGGQAVLEGVMMRGAQTMTIAVRAPDQQIVLHTEPLDAQRRGQLMRIPFVRGLVGLWDALALGWRSLSFSASIAGGEQVEFAGPLAWVTMAISIVLGIGLFFLAPAALSQWVERALGINPWFGSGLEGFVRLGTIVGYLWLISFLPDVRRLFGYHGAEHKTINAFEAGAELTPASVARFPLEHPRCGTAFLLTVVVFSILLFALLGPMAVWARLLSRVLLIPVIAGLAFEYIRFTARHLAHPLVRLLVIPNLALQRLTTRQPDLHMLEVAIAAFNAMREKENIPVA
jgi:uncharacterized protein YqhQ